MEENKNPAHPTEVKRQFVDDAIEILISKMDDNENFMVGILNHDLQVSYKA